jgi:PAS domain S-box-containing protein
MGKARTDGTAKKGPGLGVSDSRALLAAIVDSSDDAIVSKNLDGVITSWNSGAERIFGYSADEAIGQHITLIIPENRRDEETLIISRIRQGERVDHYETLRRRKDGTLVPISLTVSPIFGKGGRIIGASKIARDISERRRLEEARRVLSLEVNHRSKNLLAVVQSIIRYTVAHSAQRDFVGRISDRLQALAANQDLLIENSWRGADLAALVRFQIGQIDQLPTDRVTRRGGPLLVSPLAAQALGMALHELATNAVKFGALSGPVGTVEIDWWIEENVPAPAFVFTWREAGGPTVAAPEYAGFGTTILERITGQSLGGRVNATYASSGLTWELRAPAKALVVPASLPAGEEPG